MDEATAAAGVKVEYGGFEPVGNEDIRVIGADGDHAMDALREGHVIGSIGVDVYQTTDKGLHDALSIDGVGQEAAMEGFQ
jgi:hypothetical protein